MRYLSRIFQPVITIPKNARIKNTEITCKSQKLLLECGLIRPSSPGFFTILPLAQRALDKLEAQIRVYMEAAGAQKISLPCLTSASLWMKTGRLQDGGSELMKMKDRHGKEYLLGPTHEEALADILADVSPLSYKQLPLLLYQIGNKYRDELRPKHGLLRSREFIMMDAYGVHDSEECAHRMYDVVSECYTKLFEALQLNVHRVSAPPGFMGGAVSHEWQLAAAPGEDRLALCAGCGRAARGGGGGGDTCHSCGTKTDIVNSIEVGHTFVLGTKYSEPLGAMVTPPGGSPRPLFMSCYGLGLTRLLAAGLEARSGEGRLRWAAGAAPYSLCVIPPKEGSVEWKSHGWDATRRLGAALGALAGYREDVLVDDRLTLTIGKRLMLADKMGYPYIVVCGKSTMESPPRYELHATGAAPTAPTSVTLLTLDQLVQHLQSEQHKQQQIKTRI